MPLIEGAVLPLYSATRYPLSPYIDGFGTEFPSPMTGLLTGRHPFSQQRKLLRERPQATLAPTASVERVSDQGSNEQGSKESASRGMSPDLRPGLEPIQKAL